MARSAPDEAAFQSTLPVGEATAALVRRVGDQRISIHASRGGSDELIGKPFTVVGNFNPRFPWGKRLTFRASGTVVNPFQSTLPVGEATVNARSITAQVLNFNPRFPWGKRPVRC